MTFTFYRVEAMNVGWLTKIEKLGQAFAHTLLRYLCEMSNVSIYIIYTNTMSVGKTKFKTVIGNSAIRRNEPDSTL